MKNSFQVCLYLDVPYNEKDEAKALGAWYDGNIKKWYYKGDARNLVRFAKWILKDKEEVLIAQDIFLLKNRKTCWKCKKDTVVIALGVGQYISIYRDDETGTARYGLVMDKKLKNRVHVAWTDNEQDIPPLLLRYMKKNYPIKTGYSSVVGKTFANHCEHCGAIQGNFYLFNEIPSPFVFYAATKADFAEKYKHLEIIHLLVDCSLQLNWNMLLTDDDEVYEHCWDDEITLTGTNKIPSYKEMYDL